MVTPYFWSDAHKAYRVEYDEADSRMPGGRFTSSLYVTNEGVAKKIGELASKVRSRREWLDLFGLAMEIAKGTDAMLYRTMIGSYQSLNRDGTQSSYGVDPYNG